MSNLKAPDEQPAYMKPMKWSVYIVRCSDGTLYTGVAIDVARRIGEHQSQGSKSAKYVRGRAPLELVYTREIGDRSAAMSEEWRIKQLSKAAKEKLLKCSNGALPPFCVFRAS